MNDANPGPATRAMDYARGGVVATEPRKLDQVRPILRDTPVQEIDLIEDLTELATLPPDSITEYIDGLSVSHIRRLISSAQRVQDAAGKIGELARGLEGVTRAFVSNASAYGQNESL